MELSKEVKKFKSCLKSSELESSKLMKFSDIVQKMSKSSKQQVEKTVRFKEDKLVEEKIITALSSEEFYEDDQKKVLIVSLDTIEKLNEESEIVALKFNSLLQMKNDGVDVNEEIELLRERIKILKDIKELIIKKKQLEIKLINEYKQRRGNEDVKMEVDNEFDDYFSGRKPSTSVKEEVKPKLGGNLKEIAEKLFKHITKPNFDVCICIYSISFKETDGSKIFEVLKPLGEKHLFNLSIINVLNESQLEMCPFIKISDLTASSILHFSQKTYENIRMVIANHSWRKGTVNVFLNLVPWLEDCFKSRRDTIQDLIRHHDIKLFFSNSQTIQSLSSLLDKLLSNLTSYFFIHELINLKRFIVDDESSFNSFLTNRTVKQTLKYEQSNFIQNFGFIYKCSKNKWSNEPEIAYSRIHEIEKFWNERSLKESDFSQSVERNLFYRNYFFSSSISIKCNSEKLILKCDFERIYNNMVDIYTTAKILSEVFNKEINPSQFQITVPDVYLLKTSPRTDQETELAKETVKFTPNENDLSYDEKLVLNAFSHFTFLYTNYELLVISCYVLRDSKRTLHLNEPVIFSSRKAKKSFGSSDLGPFGIDHFFQEHICSDICKQYMDRLSSNNNNNPSNSFY